MHYRFVANDSMTKLAYAFSVATAPSFARFEADAISLYGSEAVRPVTDLVVKKATVVDGRGLGGDYDPLLVVEATPELSLLKTALDALQSYGDALLLAEEFEKRAAENFEAVAGRFRPEGFSESNYGLPAVLTAIDAEVQEKLAAGGAKGTKGKANPKYRELPYGAQEQIEEAMKLSPAFGGGRPAGMGEGEMAGTPFARQYLANMLRETRRARQPVPGSEEEQREGIAQRAEEAKQRKTIEEYEASQTPEAQQRQALKEKAEALKTKRDIRELGLPQRTVRRGLEEGAGAIKGLAPVLTGEFLGQMLPQSEAVRRTREDVRSGVQEKMRRQAEEPISVDRKYDAAIDNIKRQAILTSLMKTDEILMHQPPEKVVTMYNTLRRLAPTLSMEPEVVRAFLRSSIDQMALDSFMVEQLTNAERQLQRVRRGDVGRDEERR